MMKASTEEPEHSPNDELDDSASSFSGGASGQTANQLLQEEERKALAHRENQAVSYLRVLVYLVVLLTAVVVCFLVYRSTKNDQQQSFEDNFAAFADKLME